MTIRLIVCSTADLSRRVPALIMGVTLSVVIPAGLAILAVATIGLSMHGILLIAILITTAVTVASGVAGTIAVRLSVDILDWCLASCDVVATRIAVFGRAFVDWENMRFMRWQSNRRAAKRAAQIRSRWTKI